MEQKAYIGHESQLTGVEELRLVGGKGDGMRLMQLRNGKGLEITISEDRCADISRLHYKGTNLGFFSAGGYTAPAYYDSVGDGWLKGFTAGFLTTCGLTAAGQSCVDEGVPLGLHGPIAHTPAERVSWDEDEDEITVKALIRESRIASDKLTLKRKIACSKQENSFTITDEIENIGDRVSPLMIMYHMNMGYPLLCEDSELYVPSEQVVARNAHAAEDLDTWYKILPPTMGFEEQCYYHKFTGKTALAAIFNPKLGFGLKITFDPSELGSFTQWKMMGYKDYVLGLEPGNCTPDGRDVIRKKGTLRELQPGEKQVYHVTVTIIESIDAWQALKQ